MVKLVNVIAMIFFAVIPFVYIYFHQEINKALSDYSDKIISADLLTPYLLLTIWHFSSLALDFPFHFYFVLTIAIIAIALACYYTFGLKEFILTKFLRIWWRIVFVLSIISHTILSVVAIYRYLR